MTARIALTVLVVMTGVVTRYDADEHLGNDRRCGGTYNEHEAWVAADIDGTDWRCGDLAAICAAGECRVLPVCDSGPLSRYYVGDAPILLDLPQHVYWGDGISMPARVVNATRAWERLELER